MDCDTKLATVRTRLKKILRLSQTVENSELFFLNGDLQV